MRNDPDLIKQVNIGDIVQVSPEGPPEAFEDRFRGALAMVTGKETWGVICAVLFGGEHVARLTWNHIEPTGGRVVWDRYGKRAADAPATLRHHP